MTQEAQALSVKILDNYFSIKCPVDKAEELKQCAQYVDSQMREARKGKANLNNSSAERLAILTAINIAHSLLSQQKQIETLHTKIEHSLTSAIEATTSTANAGE